MSEYDELVDKPGSAHGAQGEPETTAEPPRKQSRARKKREEAIPIPAPASSRTCPRWMHHRKGEYCKTCDRTP